MTKTRFDILSRGLNRKRGEMNGNETRYANWLDSDPNVFRWWFEPMSLRLSSPASGSPARVTVDFLVLYKDGVTCLDDVKSGRLNDAASLVRMKAAAELYPLWKFRLARPDKKAGGFSVQEL